MGMGHYLLSCDISFGARIYQGYDFLICTNTYLLGSEAVGSKKKGRRFDMHCFISHLVVLEIFGDKFQWVWLNGSLCHTSPGYLISQAQILMSMTRCVPPSSYTWDQMIRCLLHLVGTDKDILVDTLQSLTSIGIQTEQLWWHHTENE